MKIGIIEIDDELKMIKDLIDLKNSLNVEITDNGVIIGLIE